MFEEYTLWIIGITALALVTAVGIALLVAWIIIKTIDKQPSQTGKYHTWEEYVGEKGEDKTEIILRKITGNYYILRNLYIPHKDHTTEIDLLLLHETGIFVFECKNFSGWIYGSENAKYWLQTFKRSKYKFYNPIRQNETHIQAITKLLRLKETEKPSSYIVFGNETMLKKVPRTSKCTICQHLNLLRIISDDLNNRRTKYDNQILTIYCNFLKQYTRL